MDIFLSLTGEAKVVTPERIYQSSNVSEIHVYSPFPANTSMKIGFILPDGNLAPLGTTTVKATKALTNIGYAPMTLLKTVPAEYGVNCWIYTLPTAVTNVAGNVRCSIVATTYPNHNQTSYMFNFLVEPSVQLPKDMVPDPSTDVYDLILAYLAQDEAYLQNLDERVSKIENVTVRRVLVDITSKTSNDGYTYFTKYYSDGTTAPFRIPTATEPKTVNGMTIISFSKDSWVAQGSMQDATGLYDLAFSSMQTGQNDADFFAQVAADSEKTYTIETAEVHNDRYTIETNTVHSGCVITADTIFKGSDGSLLIEGVKEPFSGQLLCFTGTMFPPYKWYVCSLDCVPNSLGAEYVLGSLTPGPVRKLKIGDMISFRNGYTAQVLYVDIDNYVFRVYNWAKIKTNWYTTEENYNKGYNNYDKSKLKPDSTTLTKYDMVTFQDGYVAQVTSLSENGYSISKPGVSIQGPQGEQGVQGNDGLDALTISHFLIYDRNEPTGIDSTITTTLSNFNRTPAINETFIGVFKTPGSTYIQSFIGMLTVTAISGTTVTAKVNAITEITGTEGAKGDKGDTGATGAQGKTGEPALMIGKSLTLTAMPVVNGNITLSSDVSTDTGMFNRTPAVGDETFAIATYNSTNYALGLTCISVTDTSATFRINSVVEMSNGGGGSGSGGAYTLDVSAEGSVTALAAKQAINAFNNNMAVICRMTGFLTAPLISVVTADVSDSGNTIMTFIADMGTIIKFTLELPTDAADSDELTFMQTEFGGADKYMCPFMVTGINPTITYADNIATMTLPKTIVIDNNTYNFKYFTIPLMLRLYSGGQVKGRTVFPQFDSRFYFADGSAVTGAGVSVTARTVAIATGTESDQKTFRAIITIQQNDTDYLVVTVKIFNPYTTQYTLTDETVDDRVQIGSTQIQGWF